MVAVSSDRAHRLGQAALLGQFAFVALGAVPHGVLLVELRIPRVRAVRRAVGHRRRHRHRAPARVRGLYLGIITLGFALTVSGFWLQDRFNTSFSGIGATLEPPKVFGYDFAADKTAYYYFCLACALIVIVIVAPSAAPGWADRCSPCATTRRMRPPTRCRRHGRSSSRSAISGGVAAFAGGLFAAGHDADPRLLRRPSRLRVLAISGVGGLSSVTGAIARHAGDRRHPDRVRGQRPATALREQGRHAHPPPLLVDDLDRRQHPGPGTRVHRPPHRLEAATSGVPRRRWPRSPTARPRVSRDGGAPPLPHARDVSVSFSGRPVVVGASIEVRDGEVVVIGTGSDKTTLMAFISGFMRSASEIEVFGDRIDPRRSYRRPPWRRGEPFRTPSFEGLSVREGDPGRARAPPALFLVPSLLALPPYPMAEQRAQAGRRDHRLPRLGPLCRHADGRAVHRRDASWSSVRCWLSARASCSSTSRPRASREGDRDVRAADQDDPARARLVDPDRRRQHPWSPSISDHLLPRGRPGDAGHRRRAQRPRHQLLPRHRRARDPAIDSLRARPVSGAPARRHAFARCWSSSS